MGIADGDFVRVTSRRGSIELRARLSHRDTPGTCFVPFHFREAAANVLTIDEVDPDGKIPEFKFCAVKIERVGQRRQARLGDRAGGGVMAAGNGPAGTAAWACACSPARRAPRPAPASSPAPA